MLKSNILKLALCDLNIDDDGQIQVVDQVCKFRAAVNAEVQ